MTETQANPRSRRDDGCRFESMCSQIGNISESSEAPLPGAGSGHVSASDRTESSNYIQTCLLWFETSGVQWVVYDDGV